MIHESNFRNANFSKEYSLLKYYDKEKFSIVQKTVSKVFDQTMTVEHFKQSIGTNKLTLKGNIGEAGFMCDDTGNVVGSISPDITKPEDIVSPMIGIVQDGKAVLYNQVENKIGALDSLGNILIPLIYNDLVFHESIVIATNSHGKKGILGGSNYKTILLAFDYDNIYSRKIDFYHNSKNLIITKNNLQGLCNPNGKILINPILQSGIDIYPDTYGEGLIGFRKGNKDGFINLNGEIILLFDKGKIEHGFIDGEARITDERGWEIINKQGKVLDGGEYPRDWGYTADELARDTWDAFTDEDYPEDGWDGDLDRFGVD